MVLELRPRWCITDAQIEAFFDIAPWLDSRGDLALEFDGDTWSPGRPLRLERRISIDVGPNELRQELGLPAGITVGVAARWSCRATSDAGTHLEGPMPLELEEETALIVDVPGSIATSVELETSVVVRESSAPAGLSDLRAGTLLWSDSWDVPTRQRTLRLAGDELRIPVRTIPFTERFPNSPEALWAIDSQAVTGLDDPLANTVVVLLNETILARDFADTDGEPDAGRLPPFVTTAVQVDIIDALVEELRDDLEEAPDRDAAIEGSVGDLILRRLPEAFGSIQDGLDAHDENRSDFSRRLWSAFAPDSWRAK